MVAHEDLSRLVDTLGLAEGTAPSTSTALYSISAVLKEGDTGVENVGTGVENQRLVVVA